MKKLLHFSNYIQGLKKELFVILLILTTVLSSAQTITPTKTVTVRPGVCGKIDVELKIQGANPVSRPLEVVLVIDVSGSMGDGNNPKPLAHAQDAAIDFINKTFLAANNPTGKNKISIVKYSNTATIVKPLTLSSGQADLISAINALTANGSTNIQDGIKKADDELTAHGTFDCVTSRSIVLLTDGVANRTGNDQSCTAGQGGSCIQSAITAATDAKTTTVSSVVYNNQIFSVGLFGAISGTDQTNAEYTLHNIQSAGEYFTETGADLTGIYSTIFTQLSWVAQQITGTPFDKETVSTDFTIGAITPSKGTASVSGQVISWNIDFLNVETITLKYELTPKSNVCGTKTVSTSRLDYKNSACTNTFLDITTPSTNIPCPSVTLASQTNVNCFGDTTGAITINNATGGTGPYTYAWKKNGSAYATTQNLTGLGAGTYTVIATDANGCASSELSITITQPSAALSIALNSQTDVKCYNDTTGAIDLTISGGTSPYTYTWKKDGNAIAATTQDLSGIGAGTYEVTVTDDKGCKATKSITINQPNAGLSIAVTSQTDVKCYNDTTGAIDLAVSGGTSPYTYSWKKDGNAIAATTQDLSGIGAGTYEVTVTDDKGCKATKSITITQPSAGLSIAVTSQTDVKCYNDTTGAIDLTISGGTSPYTYSWKKDGNAIAATTQDLSGIGAGTYEVTVTDDKGCKATKSITINQPNSALTCSIAQDKAVSSNGLSDGQATVTAIGGNGGYTYLWDNGETTQQASALNAGLHSVTVTDSKGCKTTCGITITQPDVLSCSIIQNAPAKCYGDSNGVATVTAIGGNGNYTYLWDNGETTAQAVGLNAGSHTVTVTDKLGYKTTCNVTIGQPEAALSATAVITNNNNCIGCNNGSIDLTVSGGTAPYAYLWSNGATTEDISNLPNGTYSVEITDSKGCKANYTYIISESSINITKDGTYVDSNQDGVTNVGDVVTYNFVVTNTGSVELTNVTVTDNNATITGGPIATLAVGASDSTTFSGSHVITQNDINTGYVYNLATATAKDPEDKNVTDTSSDPTPCTTCPKDPECPDCTITPLTQSPSINITKDGTYVDSNNDGITNVGDVVTYNFVVTNTGNTTLTDVTVTDNNATIAGGPIATLTVGATDSTTFSGSHVITQEDINTGYVYNLATVVGKDPKGNPVTDTSSDPTPCTTCPIKEDCPDCTITPLTQTPRLAVIKTATTASYSVVGDVINYTITVKNTGNQTLHQITVKDPLTGLDTIIDVLAPGASSEYTQSYTVTQEDLNTGSVTNVAKADGFTPNETPISASDDEIVNEKTNPIDAVDDNAGTIVGVNQTTPNVINVFTNDTLNALPVNPADVILTTVTSNPFLQMNPDGSIDVLPDAPAGTQTMTYQICEKLNNTNCDTATVTVTIEVPSMTVAGEAICINDVPYFSYTTTANNFNPVDGLTLTWTDSNNNVVATMTNLPLNGKVLWPGAIVDENGNGIDWPGWLLLDNGQWIEGSDGFENLRPTASVTFTLNPSETIIANYPPSDPKCTSRPTFKIDAVDDSAGPIDGINGASNVLNVFNNDTLNTVAVNPADVTLTLVTPDATGHITMNPDGSIDLKDGTPAGTYTLVYQICENADFGNCDTATVTITVICNNSTKVSGTVYNVDTNNSPLANVPITLTAIRILDNGQNEIIGNPIMRITNAQGYYNFTGMTPGDYVLQVQDANLNSAYELFNTTSSFLIIKVEVCNYLVRDFGYGKTDLPVLGNYVWYDLNKNGLQDEWYDSNNDGLVTKNIPDANGAIDYSTWEWIDFNGDGSYLGKLNEGELNAAGFGNGTTNIPNLFITGPNDFAVSNTMGPLGFWRVRPPKDAWGQYNVELRMESHLDASAKVIANTGLVKVLPSGTTSKSKTKTAKPSNVNSQVGSICDASSAKNKSTVLSETHRVDLDLDFGISCKDFGATDDTFADLNCSTSGVIGNVLTNDLLNDTYASADLVNFTVTSGSNPNIAIDNLGNVTITSGLAAGTYTFTYSLCSKTDSANCVSATVTITAAGIEPVAVQSTACNADSTPVDLSRFLSNGVPTTGTWIDTNNSGGLVGNILNTVGIPINQYKYEYKIGGNCPSSIVLTMNINDDCKVLDCKTLIIHNAFSANEDGRNDYFQIENLENNDCYKNIRVEVFNRWGVLVFEKDNYNNEGNAFRGRSEGRTTINKNEGLPTGTYFYIISYDTVDGQGKTLNIKKDGYLYLVK